MITNPSAAYELIGGQYQYLDYSVFDFEGETVGTLDSRGYVTSGNSYSTVYVLPPIPLSLDAFDFDFSLEGDPCEFYPQGCGTGNPDESTFNLASSYEIVASGTLNTFDGESSPAIKLRLTESYTFFDVNNNQIGTKDLRYLLWYTKDGHLVRAILKNGSPWSGQTDFVYYEYQKLANNVLPVEWLAVNAEAIKNSEVKINWSTATESLNERFVVQRSEDGQRFVSIGGLDAVGDSDVRQDYTFTDEEPLEGFNYYRIQQQDFNGRDTYSSIVSALITKTALDEELIVLYPNPGRNEVFFSRPADYELTTITRQVLSKGRVETQLNVAGLPAGTYLVRIDGGEAYRWVKR